MWTEIDVSQKRSESREHSNAIWDWSKFKSDLNECERLIKHRNWDPGLRLF